MNMALIKLQNYDPNNGPIWDADEAIDEAIDEITRLLKVEAHRDILAMAMAEVKAIADGESSNTLNEVIEHCLTEFKELNLFDGTKK